MGCVVEGEEEEREKKGKVKGNVCHHVRPCFHLFAQKAVIVVYTGWQWHMLMLLLEAKAVSRFSREVVHVVSKMGR